jgi:hypothetical protein
MGLMLMQEEIAKSSGCNSVDKLIERVKDDEDHPEATNGDTGSLACFRLSQGIQTNCTPTFYDQLPCRTTELQGGNGTGLGLHIAKCIMEQHRGT